MAEILCAKTEIEVFKPVSETLLWENPNPTATFAAQTVTLLDSLSNYTRVKVIYRPFSPVTTTGIVETPCDKILNREYDNDTDSPYIGLFGKGSTYNYSRGIYHPSTNNDFTQLYALACQRLNGSNTSNNFCVPLYIYGIKDNN